MRLLLAENDFCLIESLLKFLKKTKFIINLVSDGKAAQVFIESGLFDIVILDIDIPVVTCFEVLKNIRNKGIKIPIILLLNSINNLEDRVKGFDLGADDYLIKPFYLNELLIKIKDFYYRIKDSFNKNCNKNVKFSNYNFNLNTKTLTKDSIIIPISKKESSLLLLLLLNVGKIVPKIKILKEIYPLDKKIDINTLEVHIHNLRKKINIPNFIQTIRGVGYFVQRDKIT